MLQSLISACTGRRSTFAFSLNITIEAVTVKIIDLLPYCISSCGDASMNKTIHNEVRVCSKCSNQLFLCYLYCFCVHMRAYAQHGITYLNGKHVKLCIFFQLSASVSLFTASMHHYYAFVTHCWC